LSATLYRHESASFERKR